LFFLAANTLWTNLAGTGIRIRIGFWSLNDADGASHPAENGERAEAGAQRAHAPAPPRRRRGPDQGEGPRRRLDPEIARRAGSSVGGFYARFRDKDELLRALEERHFLELSQRLEALADARRWQNAPTRLIVEAAVAELVTRRASAAT
jgi:hypothetical protein